VVARLRPDLTKKEAETELGLILRDAGMNDWESIMEITGVAARVRSFLWSFALGLGLAILIISAELAFADAVVESLGRRRSSRLRRGCCWRWCCCAGSSSRAPPRYHAGGTDSLTEPLSTWLFMLGSMAFLVWSIADQRRRCRVCLRRLGMAAQVGCPGCLLLELGRDGAGVHGGSRDAARAGDGGVLAGAGPLDLARRLVAGIVRAELRLGRGARSGKKIAINAIGGDGDDKTGNFRRICAFPF